MSILFMFCLNEQTSISIISHSQKKEEEMEPETTEPMSLPCDILNLLTYKLNILHRFTTF